ncbi:MAG: hypothetical protein IMW89_21315 [Ktedonobacteraceae bacterium]|nr:hypothetical protein [Ktedonobacteraceae bacterium]
MSPDRCFLQLLGRFHQMYPNVEITLEVVNRVNLVDALVNNHVDMVIMGKIPTEVPVFVASFVPNVW